MCILVVALGCHPRFPIIVAHNRDENRSRLSDPESVEDSTGLVCSRDQQAGGMVLGVNVHSGKFAALTNVRTSKEHRRPESEKSSRGLLVENLLLKSNSEDALNNGVFDGFHVVFGSIAGPFPGATYAWHSPEEDVLGNLVSWRSGQMQLQKGVFVVSNQNPTSAWEGAWPKCDWLKNEFEAYLNALPLEPSISEVQEGLAKLMTQHNVPGVDPPNRLPKHFSPKEEMLLHTGSFAPWHPEFPDFGTVSQRILINDSKQRCILYFHRSTNVAVQDGQPPGRSPWERIQIGWPAETVTKLRSAL